jgi:hypothetical protein
MLNVVTVATATGAMVIATGSSLLQKVSWKLCEAGEHSARRLPQPGCDWSLLTKVLLPACIVTLQRGLHDISGERYLNRKGLSSHIRIGSGYGIDSKAVNEKCCDKWEQ